MSIRPLIISELERVAKEQEKTLAPLSDDLVLLASGLDSLCVAIIIARLENTLGFDPFLISEGVQLPMTVGDFIKSYEDGAKLHGQTGRDRP
jgi:acyl carrier protein